MNTLQINSGHVVELDNSFNAESKEVIFVHTIKGSFNSFWAYRIYNDVCDCCGHIKRQVAVEIKES